MSNTVYSTAFAANHDVHKTWYLVLNFRLSIPKNASASGGLRPTDPLPGLCPWTPLKAWTSFPQSPYYNTCPQFNLLYPPMMAVESGCSNILPRTQRVLAAAKSNAFTFYNPVSVILICNHLTSKQIHGYMIVMMCSHPAILGFLGLSVLALGLGTRKTDRRTDRQSPAII